MSTKKPVVLIILDGWGIAPDSKGNAISNAKIPNFKSYWSLYPHTQLIASGESVGLPHEEKGNSETGHLNLGAGRIVYQDLPRINLSIADGSFFLNQAFLQAIKFSKKNSSKIHLLGLIGQGGVHANNEHLFALLSLLKKENAKNFFLHLFTDGRDSPPRSSLNYLQAIEQKLQELGVGKIASISGRFYAMDRDNHYDRTEPVYNALVLGEGQTAVSSLEAVKNSYSLSLSDEFIKPTVIVNPDKTPVCLISDNDSVFFFNYRIDRPRQLTKAFVLSDFENISRPKVAFDPYAEKYFKKTYPEYDRFQPFKRKKILKNLCFVTMTEYEKNLPTLSAYPPIKINLPVGRVVAENNLRQLHISETEKERFVTYYFNGQREDLFVGQDNIIIPSPGVKTFDLKPEMSAQSITDSVIQRLKLDLYDFIIINYANPDMVGHTGVLSAGIKACETVDQCLGQLVKQVLIRKGTCIITADHGNVEEMINLKNGQVDTEHSVNPVPFIIVNPDLKGNPTFLPSGILADVAPTILSFLNLPIPDVYTGKILLNNNHLREA